MTYRHTDGRQPPDASYKSGRHILGYCSNMSAKPTDYFCTLCMDTVVMMCELKEPLNSSQNSVAL